MSDETEMNPDLERFATSLRSVPAPKANIDRDQLMYDAGWAAAIANRGPTVTVRGRGFSSLALSFAGGVAVAAAILLSVVPFTGDVSSTVESGLRIAAATPTSTDMSEALEIPATEIAAAASDEPDLLEWIENLPPGQSINSGFSTSPVLASMSGVQRSTGQLPCIPKTSGQLFRELMPSVSTRHSTPAWPAWFIPGT